MCGSLQAPSTDASSRLGVWGAPAMRALDAEGARAWLSVARRPGLQLQRPKAKCTALRPLFPPSLQAPLPSEY